MPPFRIHQTRNRPERILIRLTQGKYIFASQLPPQPVVPAVEEVKEKTKNVISLKQIKQIISLLQQTSHKDLSKMLTPELSSLLSIDDENVDKVEEEEEETKEEAKEDVYDDDDDELLIIDV